MPTYEYRCDSCEKNFDIVQSFHDDPLTACPTCGSPVRKVFGNVGIVFKGSGFYKTDSRKGGSSKASPADTPSGDTSSSDGAGSSDSAGSEGKTPATAPAGEGAAKPSAADAKGPAKAPSAPATPAKSSSKDSGS